MERTEITELLRCASIYSLNQLIAVSLHEAGVTEKDLCEIAKGDLRITTPVVNQVGIALQDIERGLIQPKKIKFRIKKR